MNRTAYLFVALGLFTIACDDGDDDDPGMRDCGVPEQQGPCGEPEPDPMQDCGCTGDDFGVDMGDVCVPHCPEGLQVNICADDNPQCIAVEQCGQTIFCSAESTACDMASYPGTSDPCPEGDPNCTNAAYFNGMPVQCLPELCRDAIDGIEPPACPNAVHVQPCADASCDGLAWCGQVWAGCEMACAPDEIPGTLVCEDRDCDPTVCVEDDRTCTQSTGGGLACYASECAGDGPSCTDLDIVFDDIEETEEAWARCQRAAENNPEVACHEVLVCGRIKRCESSI